MCFKIVWLSGSLLALCRTSIVPRCSSPAQISQHMNRTTVVWFDRGSRTTAIPSPKNRATQMHPNVIM
ncbi:hypothetical protein K443DRAFT_678081 [Laccaria amethystina LaAM-08-1]|uniref:Secreted protein n=1 Tax=Laccaria amethystina LaAM-08-1 TaxID=1095629 RepID=A0A0C9XJW9_9AGAR|nr:hypothetical protein K443DRAFT_678081 [Laccaria amethystina LaAM-08-1]